MFPVIKRNRARSKSKKSEQKGNKTEKTFSPTLPDKTVMTETNIFG